MKVAFLARVDLALGGELVDLALGDDRARAGQDLEDLEAAVLGHQLEAAAEEEVADKDRRRIAEDDVSGRLATPKIAAVDHVVMQ